MDKPLSLDASFSLEGELAVQWLSTARTRHWLVKGAVGHGDDRPIGRDKGRHVRFLMEHCFLFVCGQSTRSMASDLKGTLNQVRYMHYIYITPNLKLE